MILVDTSVWIEHLRSGLPSLVHSLDAAAVLVHPWVIGELALGNLTNRIEILGLLRRLPQSAEAEADEVLFMIEHESLTGSGIGYVDAQLLASTRLTPGARLWTRDRRLAAAADRLGMRYDRDAGSP
ncbi:type II toxin-antitoxin system VapC family toxin [Aldersonia sp. NBC_00410]|uniref:type II toxin-antitoxin system VapC family toxin n=1 Tax=Aldersonia sp. NBC_00410 TaxID=2975954 RepID=UPI002253CA0E|nr:type II toxin-antitoxin system VapC family toxin [Aldersonia sp. NBC_00410]MCX5043617.1 type II toxin-antitoxin system VapC family toxin [Aldersonia sp. NBC_00410]